MRDLLVAGGGPIGLATALYAAREGLDVGVREPRAGVIDKACGEGLMPAAVAALRDLGVRLDGHPLTGIRYLDGDRSAEAAFRHGDGLGVRRTALHAALRDRAAEAGITTDHRPVREVTDHADHLMVDGERTRFLVAADGLHSPVRRLLGLGGPPARRQRYGLRCHVDIEPWTSLVEVHWSDVGEAYVTPVADARVGVAVLSTERRPLEHLLAEFPQLTERLGARMRSRVRGAGPLHQRSRSRVAGRVLLVGDAAGYIDALTGEGIGLGMAQAQAAVAAVVDAQPERYAAQWRRLVWRHDLLTATLVAATSQPFVRRRIVGAAAVLPFVFDAAVDQLAKPRMTALTRGRPTVEYVVLLDEDGRSIGVAPKDQVHHQDTPLHLAFSCYVFDHGGQLLLTRRALSKKTWPGAWTNTCCGHPLPGESVADSVRRRGRQELGIDLTGLRLLIPDFRYRAVMDDGTVENEMCPVYSATCVDASTLAPDPTEVDAVEWVDWRSFRADVLTGRRQVSPWCVEQLKVLSEDPR